MDDFLNLPRKKRALVEPQMMSFISIFSMLILFLVAGTAFETTTVDMPSYFRLPLSLFNRPVELSLQVLVSQRGVQFPNETEVYPLEMFLREGRDQPSFPQVQQKIKSALKIGKPSINLSLSLVADQNTSYKVIFDVVETLRYSGVKSIQFISQSQND